MTYSEIDDLRQMIAAMEYPDTEVGIDVPPREKIAYRMGHYNGWHESLRRVDKFLQSLSLAVKP